MKNHDLLSDLSAALLLTLQQNQSTGYDLTKHLSESRLRVASHQQIYKELNRMAEMGLVQNVTEVQTGKPDKKIYTPTDKGIEETVRKLSNATAKLKRINFIEPLLFMIGDTEYFREVIRLLNREIDDLNVELTKSKESNSIMALNLRAHILTRTAERDIAQLYLENTVTKPKELNDLAA
ncbi:TPA: PadR family transcriptional regulator [Vibrio vulnificus]|uniref:PadR family transcriptional regulator n=2 Tax=Vibrio TaxID=662 RepID=UPI0004DEEC67|nr:PadR family transcriptional regulator [Vibrio parahaemolyticus]